ncbi:hypothetical protein NECAME_03713 [Necator americanus]|uniref:TUG ubiquitin-like domain-containing protein n=1 Tax=Necator americanus TaxID=51031 RepID=W2T0U9_NECAM|nr:hypothetical protein NECAME_03713 [Necator americanus]ETN75523.1 hypothetical protein NECAME_03713 [Necator americanus]
MSVTVLCPNARRCPVKVTPGTLLKQVLEEACLKHGFDVEAYQLVGQKGRVDLSLPFRLSGLPNNATLEMVPSSSITSEAVVTIALEVPERTRMELKFPATASLLLILERFSPLYGEDLTRLLFVFLYRHYDAKLQYIGQKELERTTLSSIGITSGRYLIRYQRLPLTEELKAKISIRLADDTARKDALLLTYSQKIAENVNRATFEYSGTPQFKEDLRFQSESEEREPRAINEVPQTQNVATRSFDAPSFSLPNQRVDGGGQPSLSRHPQQGSSTTAMLTNPLVVPSDRQTVIFRRQSSTESSAVESELSDEFFEIGLDDLKSLQKELHEEVQVHTQRALLPKKYVIEKNRENKLKAYCHTVIRVPVGTEQIIQAQFLSAEPVSHLYDWVRSISSRNVVYSLHLAPNEKIEESESKNFVDVGIAPKSTVFVKCKGSNTNFESLICSDLMKCTKEEADKLSADWLSHNSKFVPFLGVLAENDRNGKRPASSLNPMSPEPAHPPQKTGTAPKWFKKK